MRAAVFMVVLGAVVGSAAGARAQTVTDPFWFGPGPRIGIARVAPQRTNRVDGKVTEVAPRQGGMVVFDYESNEPYWLGFDRDTKVIGPRGRRLSLEQLRPGEQVLTDFDLEGGRMVAGEIEVLAPTGSPPENAPGGR